MPTNNFNEFHRKFYDEKQELERKRARLFPSMEKLKVIDEDVASNIFLANLVGIREFYVEFFKQIDLKINKNMKIHAYTQVDFDSEIIGGSKDVPDGILVITEGKTNPIVSWVALLEFKTKSPLRKDQVLRYSEIARNARYKFDALITVSNDFVSDPKQNPFDLRNYVSFNHFHFSWMRIQTILQYVRNKGIEDEDQVYLAEQFLMYLDGHRDIVSFDQMNKDWPEQCRVFQTERITKTKHKDLLELVALDWLQEEQDIGLKTKARYHKNLLIKIPEDEKAHINKRMNALVDGLVSDQHSLSTIYRLVPSNDRSSPFFVSKRRYVDLEHRVSLKTKRQSIQFNIITDNPQYKTIKKQVEALLQSFLKTEPGLADEIRLRFFVEGKRDAAADASLEEYSTDLGRDVMRRFGELGSGSTLRKVEVFASFELGRDFNSRKGFITRIELNFDDFFSQIIEPFVED